MPIRSLSIQDVKASALDRCLQAAQHDTIDPRDSPEAHLYAIAAMVLRWSYPMHGERLRAASERYFSRHPQERIDIAQSMPQGLLGSFTTVRDRLERRLLSAGCSGKLVSPKLD